MMHQKPRRRRFFSFKAILKIVAVLLLLWLGVVLGVRYARTGKLIFGLEKIAAIRSSLTVGLSKPSEQLIGTAVPSDKKVSFDTFWEVWNHLEREYLEPDKLNAQEMVNGAISGMTASLGDPYTTYLPPVDNQRSGEDLAGMFYGVGIELGYIDGTLAVIAPVKGSPAERAGVLAGDLILHAKDEKKGLDEDTNGWSLDQAVNNIRGGKGEPISLTLFRQTNGSEPFVVELVREEIVVESAQMDFVEFGGRRAAHIKLSRFGERTQDEWNDIVSRILAQKDTVDGVILDMRNNPGGYFDTSVDLAGDFFRTGVVVSQKGRAETRSFSARGQGRLSGIPVVVLVNRGSASASEILAGALRDNIGAKLVGDKTFGKGTVQDRLELSNGGGLHVTIGQWLMPKGESIQKTGLTVDVEVQDNPDTTEDEVLHKGIEQL